MTSMDKWYKEHLPDPTTVKNVTPITYRQQIARDRLKQLEEERKKATPLRKEEQ